MISFPSSGTAALLLLVMLLIPSLSACQTTPGLLENVTTSTASVYLSTPMSAGPSATPNSTLPNENPTSKPESTLISALTINPTATTESTPISETSTPVPESTATPTQTTGPAASPTPDQVARGDNLLVNPSFDQGFSGWNLVNNYWSVSTKKCTPSPNERAAQIDRDGKNLWQGGEEDWLRQDVQASMPHTKVVFSLYEVHHMRSGLAETSIYGSEDGVNWERVWFRPEPDAEYGSGKPNCVAPWPTFTYSIDVGSGYHYYRLEFHFLAVDPNDGWKFTSLDLHLVP